MKNKNLVILSLIVLIALFVGASYMYKSSEVKKVTSLAKDFTKAPYIRDFSPSFGDNKKGVYVVEFIDPQCYACAVFSKSVQKLYKENYNDMKLVVRYLSNHSYSNLTIKILEAARIQDKFLEVLHIIYKTQDKWAKTGEEKPELIYTFIKEIQDLDVEKLKNDMKYIDIEKTLAQNTKDANTLGVSGTPTIFINGEELKKLSPSALEDLYFSKAYK